MARLTYETIRNGFDVWLATDARHMTVEVRRAGTLLAKSEAPHYGILGPNSRSPEKSPFAEYLIDGALSKALGRPQRSSFDLLCDAIARGMASRRKKKVLLFKAKPAKRAVLFAKAQRDHEHVSLRTAGLLTRAHQHPASSYAPNAPVDERALRRVLKAAKRGVLSHDDVLAVQHAHRDGLALPSHVLRKLADWRP